METICNTTSLVYNGMSRFVIILRAPPLIVSCRNVRHRARINRFCQSIVLYPLLDDLRAEQLLSCNGSEHGGHESGPTPA